MSNINQTLASKLVHYRKQHHMTQENLAEKLSVTFQAVSKWETARSAPDLAFLPMLADLFGCSIDELLGYTPSSPIVTYELPWDDNSYHAALFKGHKLIDSGEAIRKFTFVIEAETVEHLNVHGNAEIHGDVHQRCEVKNNADIVGGVIGDCSIGNNLTINGNIIGDPGAGNNLSIKGDVTGDCAAGNNINAETVKGDCAAGGNVTIDGYVTAESISAGSIRVGGNVTLKGEAHVGVLQCDSISGGTIILHEE